MSNRTKNASLLLGVAFGGAWLCREMMRRRREVSLSGQVALITGGSRGLGLLLAKELAREGCRLAICARDAEELERAKYELEREGAEVYAQICDLTSPVLAEELIEAVQQHYGHIDILVNNAATNIVGPAQDMRRDDFQKAMDINFYGALHAILEVLPHMRRRQYGRIVNIASVGGRVAVPHLLPYSCSKFAVTGLSEGLRAELRRDNILVTTILPGTMRTGSHRQAFVKGKQEAEYANFALSASLPLVSMSAEVAARQIVAATKRGDAERVLSLPAQALTTLHGLFPGMVSDLFGYINAVVLPEPIGRENRTRGAEVEARMNAPAFRLMTLLGDRAAHRLNQYPDRN